MLITTLALSYLAPLGIYPSRRLAIVLAAPLGVVLASAVAASAVAMACLVALIGAMALSGSGTAPTSPGYLDRAAPTVQTPTAPTMVVASPQNPIRILPPMWAEPAPDAIAEDLLAKHDRAVKSRHRVRAERYWARYVQHIAQTTVQA